MSPTHFAPWSPAAADPFDARKAAHLLRRAGFGAPPERGRQGRRGRPGGDRRGPLRRGRGRGAATSPGPSRRSPASSSTSPTSTSSGPGGPTGWSGPASRSARSSTLFWHGHFATSIEKVDDAHLMHRQIETLRRLAWGNFRDLVLAMARDPAMLVWLDGESSTKAHPNENFGRELMELFTCGIGHYTEADVQAAARAFTGWHRDGAEFAFQPDDHDAGRKTFLGKSGRFDGGDIVDLLIQHPATPRRIAAKLLRFFAAPEPAPEVVDEAAAPARADPARRQVVPPRAVPVALLLLRGLLPDADQQPGRVRRRDRPDPGRPLGRARRSPSRWPRWARPCSPRPTSRGGTARRSGSTPAPGPPGPTSPGRSPGSKTTARSRPTSTSTPSSRPRLERARRGRRPPGRGPPPGRPGRRDPPGPGRLPRHGRRRGEASQAFRDDEDVRAAEDRGPCSP